METGGSEGVEIVPYVGALRFLLVLTAQSPVNKGVLPLSIRAFRATTGRLTGFCTLPVVL